MLGKLTGDRPLFIPLCYHYTGGGDGRKGRNTLVRADKSEEDLGGKKSVQVLSGVCYFSDIP